ncbi:AAA family ATPase [Streptomyces sp. NPDC006476]|uniref:AAA family ATPase n=1 Tax=Streptomyces sp. NPDC006476 TaxID=3157175 RepID=UPI0033BB636C
MDNPRRLILLYGPPAVGKLTVGKELAQLLPAALLHNHLTYNLAVDLLSPGGSFEVHRRFASRLRLHAMELLFEYDARDIATTFCYGGRSDNWYIDKLKSLCRKHGAMPYFAHLAAENEVLLSRVENRDRLAFGKVNSRTRLEEILQGNGYTTSIQSARHIRVDTSTLPPRDAAITLMNWMNGKQQ